MKKVKKHAGAIRRQTTREMLRLVTNGFGLVAALAWNEVIKEIVSNYIKPFVGESSGLISLLIYALVVTILAVMIGYNLNNIVNASPTKRKKS